MATKETPPPPPAADSPPPKKGKKLLVIALGAVVLLVAIAGTAFVLLKPPPADDEEVTAAETKKGKKKKTEKAAGPPAYLKLEAFTVNIQGEAGDQFLRLEVSAQFEEALESERAKQYMPSIRNKVLLLLSGKKAAELGPKEGKEKLAVEIRNEMNSILAQDAGDAKGSEGPVKDVLFTEFVVQ
jgi:flagellar FliL protein